MRRNYVWRLRDGRWEKHHHSGLHWVPVRSSSLGSNVVTGTNTYTVYWWIA